MTLDSRKLIKKLNRQNLLKSKVLNTYLITFLPIQILSKTSVTQNEKKEIQILKHCKRHNNISILLAISPIA